MPTAAPVLTPDTETKEEQKLAPRWKVILHNDDVTTFAFVIELLITLFKKPSDEAIELTNEIHHKGSAVIIVTSFERAELYVDQVRSLARPRGFPLTATMEKE
jgi:ATP-dependent Clp protease adaptor protein ClpS